MPELTPDELARQPGPAALLEAFRELGGEATPGELRLRTRMAPSTVSKWLGELRAAGLVDGPKPKPHLTHEGWARSETPAIIAGANREDLDAAIARWPAEPQRAFLRMLVAAIVSRWHLAGQRPQRHPGFVAAGRTGTGKTSMAQFVCRVLGLDAEAHIIYLASRTAGEVLGRREMDPQTAEWRYDPSPLLGRPLLVFDEFDKANRDQQRAALLCFQGDTRAVIEETSVHLRAVPMLACNTQEQLPIPAEYRRRSVVLNMDPFADALDDLDLALYELDAVGGPPRLELDSMRPALARLPPDVYKLLRDVLRAALTSEGWTLCNVDAVELIALGYTAGTELQGLDLDAVTLTAARDYLTCAETVDETRPGWRRELAQQGHGAELTDALKAGQVERERVEVARSLRAVAREREALDLVGHRQTLAEQLRQARPDARGLLRENRPAGQGLRAQLDHLRQDVLASRSEASLDALRPTAEALLASVTELTRRDQRTREDAQLATEQERLQRQAAVRQQRGQLSFGRAQAAATRDQAAQRARQMRTEERARRQAARDELKGVRAAARRLERLWDRTGSRAGGSPLEVLPTEAALGAPLLVFEPDSADTLGSGIGARLLGALAGVTDSGIWHSPHEPSVFFHGTATTAEGLDRWGPGSRRVLAPVLRQLHAREDQLAPIAGLKPRPSRALVA